MRTINLNGNWQALLPSKNLQFSTYIPGDLVSALIEHGHVENPYWAQNELNIQWINSQDWTASKEFTLEAGEQNLPGWIEFQSVDCIADFYLNDHLLGSSTNMFKRLRFSIEGLLLQGRNNLRIEFKSAEKAAIDVNRNLPYPTPCSKHFEWVSPHRNLIRKVQCHSGWDWGPAIMTSGIYEDVLLFLGQDARVEYMTTRQILKDTATNLWELAIQIDAFSETAQTAEIELEFGNENKRLNWKLPAGESSMSQSFILENPGLWWPTGMGEQNLYDLKLRFNNQEITKHIGFRELEVISEEDEYGKSMFFRVNGRNVFAKGSNWIPVDALPSRQSENVYRRLLQDAVAANMNMIRVWGGGQYEKDDFYNICDELGILVWQDMMFSCALYPATPDFLENVRGEIHHQIKRLMDHPSIALWCGNNEDLGALTWYPESRANRDRYLVDYDRLNEGTIGAEVRAVDPKRCWWPSSPSAGEGDYSDCWHDDSKGDMHYWSVWHEGLPFEAYYDVTPRFCSEFGFQSFAGMRTVASYTPEDELNLTSPVMRHHQKNDRGNTIILSTMAAYFRMPRDFENSLYLSQVQQAWAIRAAVEYWRSKRPVSMGALIWQLNDNWPVASWSSIEYNGDWKLLHYECARFYSPLWVSMYEKDGKMHVYGLNDRVESASGTLTIQRMAFDGRIIASHEIEATVEGDSAREIWSSELPEHSERATSFLTARWETSQGTVRNSLLLEKPRNCYLEKPQIQLHRADDSDTAIVIEAVKPAFFVQPYLPHSCKFQGRFSDAGFTLLPGEPKTLYYIPTDGKLPPNLMELVNIRDLRGSY